MSNCNFICVFFFCYFIKEFISYNSSHVFCSTTIFFCLFFYFCSFCIERNIQFLAYIFHKFFIFC